MCQDQFLICNFHSCTSSGVYYHLCLIIDEARVVKSLVSMQFATIEGVKTQIRLHLIMINKLLQIGFKIKSQTKMSLIEVKCFVSDNMKLHVKHHKSRSNYDVVVALFPEIIYLFTQT